MNLRGREWTIVVLVFLLISLTTSPSVSTSIAGPSAPVPSNDGAAVDSLGANAAAGTNETDFVAPFGKAVDSSERAAPGSIDSLDRFEAIHDNVTGKGVQVGVIGSRFSPKGSAITSHVSGTQRFTDGPRMRVGSPIRHDTAVAEVVARVAPDADIYLASIGLHSSPQEYAAAVEWLLRQEVDVIVDAASYFPRTGANARRLNAVASNATERGVVFVTSAGNYATRHWTSSTNGNGWITFAEGTQVNPLSNGTISGQVRLRLYWSSSANYDLYLYKYRANGPDPVVAKSVERQRNASAHAEAIDVSVPEGRYYVAVYARTTATRPTQLDLFSIRQRLTYTVANGSMVAPATASNVIAVGSASRQSGAMRLYSSRGGSLDVTAPAVIRTRTSGTFRGTSAAAPFVAGTIALMEARHGNLTPAEAEHILETTATRSGNVLRIDPIAAVHAAGTDSRSTNASEDDADRVPDWLRNVTAHLRTEEIGIPTA